VGAVDLGLVNEAADHINSGVQLVGELGQAGVLLAARHQVAVQAGEPQGVGAVVQAALLAVDDHEAALDVGVPGDSPLTVGGELENWCAGFATWEPTSFGSMVTLS
jgi:hypothetical protein